MDHVVRWIVSSRVIASASTGVYRTSQLDFVKTRKMHVHRQKGEDRRLMFCAKTVILGLSRGL